MNWLYWRHVRILSIKIIFQEEHFNFVYAASILRAQQYNLNPITDRAAVAQLATAIEVPSFSPKSGMKIAVTEAEAKEHAEQMGGG